MNFSGIPIVGVVDGTTVNLVTATTGKSQTAPWVETVGGANSTLAANQPQPSLATAWSFSQIDAVACSSSGGIVGLGHGITNAGTTVQIAWVKTSGSWQIGPSGLGSIRPTGILHDGTTYVIGDDSNLGLVSGSMTFENLPPSGGFASDPPIYAYLGNGSDSVVKGSVVVGSSLSMKGTWTGPDWYHDDLGMHVGLKTTAYKTKYTFPGAAGTALQVQKVYGVTNGDTPPTIWGNYTLDFNNVANEPYKNYYGIYNTGQITVTWSE
jgi:hypothetical protein